MTPKMATDKVKTAMNSATLLKVLGRVARSSWGKQGVGRIVSRNHAYLLIATKCVTPTKDDGIYALTLTGFRFLERLRISAEIQKAKKGTPCPTK